MNSATKTRTVLGLLLACLSAPSAFGVCAVPDAPGLPDGSTADLAAMVEGQQAVKAYMADAEAYLDCLIAEEVAAGDTDTEEQRLARNAAHDSAVDAMESLAEAFNAEIRAYKAQSP